MKIAALDLPSTDPIVIYNGTSFLPGSHGDPAGHAERLRIIDDRRRDRLRPGGTDQTQRERRHAHRRSGHRRQLPTSTATAARSRSCAARVSTRSSRLRGWWTKARRPTPGTTAARYAARVIVVIGGLGLRGSVEEPEPDGLAPAIAVAAAAAGARVELISKAGDDPAGDAALLALAACRRRARGDPARPIPVHARPIATGRAHRSGHGRSDRVGRRCRG